jgi:hypothetical protein
MSMNLDPQLLSTSQDQTKVASSSKLRVFPPPLFSRQAIPQGYKLLFQFFSHTDADFSSPSAVSRQTQHP